MGVLCNLRNYSGNTVENLLSLMDEVVKVFCYVENLV